MSKPPDRHAAIDEAVQKDLHRKQLIELRNQLTDHLDGRTKSTEELIETAQKVTEQGKKLHEQIQGRKKTNGLAVDVSGNDSHMSVLAQPRTLRPAVTAEQYARGREVLDALPPGIYLKCSRCLKWQIGGDITFAGGSEITCEKCA